ncbi:hypothetical protein GCM10007872_28910 [Gluconobacter sphaericus NBRC 12467]|uniref:Uncharacterized protein n=1 Tax=Gluconobacter sphaericus NBRC 12467 TaxID=1307951 RepID=A0AA37SKP4_9PROT|nr:hypothetical protein GCM10007872_28910 [Gluconobacter sphaericus NBRC 12467]
MRRSSRNQTMTGRFWELDMDPHSRRKKLAKRVTAQVVQKEPRQKGIKSFSRSERLIT